MASHKSGAGSGPNTDHKTMYEWPISSVARTLVTNRNVGSPSTINIMLTFPTAQDLDVEHLSARLVEVQQHWPLLSATVADQRSGRPKLQYRYSTWDPKQVLAHETYVANVNDAKAERDVVYDMALRMFQSKISFDQDPLWRVTIFRASTDAEQSRLYFSLTMDHVITDGRGAVKLAQALVADDISHLPKEDIELYEKTGLNSGLEERPSVLFILSAIFQLVLPPRLPAFTHKWIGYAPPWPQKIPRPTIDSPWKSSILDIPADLMLKLKEVGKRHGVATLNPTLHTAWAVTIWAMFARRAGNQVIRDFSIKDLRDVNKGDPYCLAGHATAYLWSTGALTDKTEFWALAKSYATVSVDPQACAYGDNLMRLLHLSKEGPIDPHGSKFRAPDTLELPAGDKRAHTRREEGALKKINSLSPYTEMSGIWSNVSYFHLPKGATDMIFGVSGNATGTAFNTCLIGHENGIRIQNAYSDGAAMKEEEVKEAERMCLGILETIARDEGKDVSVSVGELVGV
ncbi:hypothetical protein GQ53DRAFT_835346 [Thozetella sp. PMI_491]|nr:hypothetical protein GQ53DRAFT_835346 [Thozetella sp. PMI_491]